MTDKLVFRQQRDDYAIEYDTPKIGLPDGLYFVEDAFRLNNWRLAVLMSVRNPATGTYSLDRLESTLYPVTTDPDSFQAAMIQIAGGELRDVLLLRTLYDIDEDQYNMVIQSGDLHLITILHTLFDIDEDQYNLLIQSGTLVVIVISHTLFDIDEDQYNMLIQSGTLVVIVISHSLFDIDEDQYNVLIQSGTLV